MTRVRVPSGRDWLSDLPIEWEVAPAKALFAERREPNHPNDVHLTPSQVYGVLPQAEYMARTGNSVVQNLQGQDSMKHVEPQDFIIHLRSFQGGIERSTHEGKVSSAYTVLQPKAMAVPDYFRWLLKSVAYIQELRTTTNQLRDGQSIRFGDFVKLPLPLPPAAEQGAIARYLDDETAKIDSLIAKQERLVALLQERRVAMLAEAVHGDWATAPLATVLDLLLDNRGKTPRKMGGDDFTDEGVPVVSAVHIKNGRVILAERERFVPQWMFEKWMPERLRRGDVLLTSEAPLGNVAQVESDDDLVLSQRLFALRGKRGVLDSTFLRLFLESEPGQQLLVADASGSIVTGIRRARLVQLPIPIPPHIEQRRIVERVMAERTRMGTLARKAERFIELAKERRAALITAAVTGQIDVRGEVA